MADFISVPMKKASDVDLVKPLKNIIASLYSTADKPEDFSSSINELNKLRSQALSKNIDKSAAALELLYKYYDQISALETKIPPQEVQIPFKWKDAFDKGGIFGGRVAMSVSSLSYEKVCVLYNIAAMQSHVAAQARTGDSDAELKSAAKLLQMSSGIFSHLKMAATTMGGQEPTADLSGDCVAALSALMVAQAQELFVKKAVTDKMKSATVAKICVQCEDMYAEALKLLQRETVKHLWEKDCITMVAAKQAAYSGLAQFHQAQVCEEKKQIGEQITRLNQTIDIIKQAQHRSGNPNFFMDYLNKANRQVAQAKKDNDFIYHERVLDASELAPLEKSASARIAKPLPVPDRMSTPFKDLFEDLVPVQVHQAIATCEVRKTEMTNTKISQLREATQLLNSILASLNLPAALEDSQSNANDVPSSLREKARAVVEAGGYQGILNAIQEIPELVQRNKEILDETERMLREEEESDSQLKAQLKEKWTRTPSDKLNGTFKTNAGRYREIINNALAADEVVRGKLATHQQAIETLSNGEQNLTSVLPQSSSSNKCKGSESAKEQLKMLMIQVERIKSDREAIEGKLKTLSFDLKTPFLNALAQDGAINEPVISVELLGRALGDLDNQVKESIQQQERIVAEIQSNSDEYFGKQSASNTLDKRDQIMRQLAEGYDAFMDLQSNIKEGRKFYNDLTQLLLAFQSKVNDFCFARKTEKEELLRDVTRDASSSSATSAPPRPPPPTAAAPPSSAPAPEGIHGHAPPPSYAAATGPGAPGALPYPPAFPPSMPMPYGSQPAPYPFTPMPATFNPYATLPFPSNYPYPPQQYATNPYYNPGQQPPQPPPQ